jgi:hypothetical protein
MQHVTQKNRSVNLILACICLFLVCRPASAYIDAGSGSYLIQILFASALGGIYIAKNFIRGVVSAITQRVRRRRTKEVDPTDLGS